MDAEEVALDAAQLALTLVGMGFPAALPFIAVAKAAVPALLAAQPYIIRAVKDGQSAFAAAQQASPQLGQALKEMSQRVGVSLGDNDQTHVENLTRGAFGLPRMTFDEEMAWMARATPGAGDSRAGSG